MATYNHANFVIDAIDSVLAQTSIDFEFLISDDGSTDSTREVVASIKDPRIKFFPNEINRGACVVTNELIHRSTGEFIALINSDDYWCDNTKLKCQVQYLRDHPAVAACFGKARFIDKNNAPLAKSMMSFGDVFDQPNRSRGAWLRRFFELGNCICHPTMLIRRECYTNLGVYSNRLRQLPDLDMWIRLVKHFDIHVLDKEFIAFRLMPGENASSQTVPNSIRTINEHYLIAEDFFDGVNSEMLVDGFSDLLKSKIIESDIHLDIEKALLYITPNQWLGKPYQMIGIQKLNALLNSPPHYKIMVEQYNLGDRWFHDLLGDVDVLRPKIFATVSSHKSKVSHILRKFLEKLKF
ncbi:glycosyltransferase [Variovorax sp. PCZ-1]|nr:glycosyltransferase [Variovorax sp. PCZ-1]